MFWEGGVWFGERMENGELRARERVNVESRRILYFVNNLSF